MNNTTNQLNLLLLPGDGIGPEVIAQARRVIERLAALHNIALNLSEGLLGGTAIDQTGDPCPPATLELASAADAILLGAVGGPSWDDLPMQHRPEKGLLRIRAEFGFFANYRPAKVYPALAAASPLRAELTKDVDILFLRELVGGIYFGEPRGSDGNKAYNTMVYSRAEIERLAVLGFQSAQQRRHKLCSVDKANVLEVSALWREVVTEVSLDYPEVELSHLYVDNAAMQLLIRPADFDVVITGNLFGDILSDLSAQLVGSIGMLPSASLNAARKGLYEPVHGSAPDLVAANSANPLAAILSAAMLLRFSGGFVQAATQLEQAVERVLASGLRSADLLSAAERQSGKTASSCSELGDAVINAL